MGHAGLLQLLPYMKPVLRRRHQSCRCFQLSIYWSVRLTRWAVREVTTNIPYRRHFNREFPWILSTLTSQVVAKRLHHIPQEYAKQISWSILLKIQYTEPSLILSIPSNNSWPQDLWEFIWMLTIGSSTNILVECSCAANRPLLQNLTMLWFWWGTVATTIGY